MKTKTGICILLMLGVVVAAQGTAPYLLPIWNGHWNYLSLGKSFQVTGSVIDVPTTQGPAGAPGVAGPQGPAGAQGLPFAVAANGVFVLSAPQAVFPLTCGAADIYRNGLLQAEGGADYSMDATGLVATFAQPAQAGDVVKVIYRCAGGAQ